MEPADEARQPPVVPIAQLPLLVADLRLDDAGQPRDPLVYVDLTAQTSDDQLAAAVRACARANRVVVGVADGAIGDRLRPLTAALACTITTHDRDRSTIATADVAAECAAITATVGRAPRAAVAGVDLLRLTQTLPVRDGLIAESLTYSMLQGASEFRRWRAGRPEHDVVKESEPPVLLRREDSTLIISLNRPARRNAVNRALRDALVDAFDLVRLDPTITLARLNGRGPAFCSGGDLTEFGSFGDVAAAHLVRLDRSVAARLDECRDRVEVSVHGACVGAGIEIAAFAGRVVARPDAYFGLPELGLGLVPGAGGTVGITRRIGRWRTAYLLLSGQWIDRGRALDWGLIDAVDG